MIRILVKKIMIIFVIFENIRGSFYDAVIYNDDSYYRIPSDSVGVKKAKNFGLNNQLQHL